jgi:hypothetical protein
VPLHEPARMTSPADVHAIAEQVYRAVAPRLGVHVLCREFALVVCGVAAALQVEHEFVVEGTHAFVRFSHGSISENWFRNGHGMPFVYPSDSGRCLQ